MSGTSLRIAIANENGATNSVSAHTGPAMEPAKCAYTARFTTTERTPEMHSDASAGKRFSRSGGTEYTTPTASPASTPANSTNPCVRASTTGTAPQTPTIHHACVI